VPANLPLLGKVGEDTWTLLGCGLDTPNLCGWAGGAGGAGATGARGGAGATGAAGAGLAKLC